MCERRGGWVFTASCTTTIAVTRDDVLTRLAGRYTEFLTIDPTQVICDDGRVQIGGIIADTVVHESADTLSEFIFIVLRAAICVDGSSNGPHVAFDSVTLDVSRVGNGSHAGSEDSTATVGDRH